MTPEKVGARFAAPGKDRDPTIHRDWLEPCPNGEALFHGVIQPLHLLRVRTNYDEHAIRS